jgi:1-deoxy-D-xylulose-5-phosphate reductoisomerase
LRRWAVRRILTSQTFVLAFDRPAAMPVRTVCLLGSTGSIGTAALDVLRTLPDTEYELVGVAANRGADAVAQQAREFSLTRVALSDSAAAATARAQLGRDVEVFDGPDAPRDLVAACEADIVVSAITGAAGLPANLAAIAQGARLALANKESLVAAGDLLMRRLRESPGAELLPVDSEHSALFQALAGAPLTDVARLILTASGGPFRDRDPATFADIRVAEALKHPTWAMGRKITIDSATMINKTLEVLEAHHLFGIGADRLAVVVHPQSLIHSLVEFVDGSIVAQMSVPDMRVPIQYALTWPERRRGPAAPFRTADFASMTFAEPDYSAFPGLALGFDAARAGGTMGAVLNAANEVAVDRFLAAAHRDDATMPDPAAVGSPIRFTDIPRLVADAMAAHDVIAAPDLDTITAVDADTRGRAREWTPAD